MKQQELANRLQNFNFEEAFKKLGYTFFINNTYNVNIIGVRNLTEGVKQDDTFNDCICLVYKVKNSQGNQIWTRKIYQITTDPGLKALYNPTASKGTAILVPGQYRGVYKIDIHNGKYQALCQRLGSVKVYRDGNKNDILDFNPITVDKGIFGINIHRSSIYDSKNIGPYSYGCQVFRVKNDFDSFMNIIKKSAALYGNKFTYTLVTTEQLGIK